MNKIILMGRLVSNPEIRNSKNKLVANCSIAVRRNFKNAQGEYETDFFNLTSFGKTAEFIEKYLTKGIKVVVEGKICNNNYEKDGKTIYQDCIIIDSVEFAESKSSQKNNKEESKEDEEQEFDNFI